MTNTYEVKEILPTILKAALENHAILRMILANQVMLMERLGFTSEQMEIPKGVFSGLDPTIPVDTTDLVSVLLMAVDPISGMLQHRAWQYAKMNTGDNVDED